MKFFLPIEEFPVDSFCKIRALFPRRYMAKQGIRVLNMPEILKSLWSHPFFFDLGQVHLSFSDKFGMIILFLATFVLDVNARVSLKAATNGSFKR